MGTHHDQIIAAAAKHNWTVRESSSRWIEMRRGRIDLAFSFRTDGRVAGGSREDTAAPPGYRFTDYILKNTKNRLGTAIEWITEDAPQRATVDLDNLR